MADITIVFPTFNRPDEVRFNLAKIRECRGDVDVEVIIIDNSPESETYDLDPGWKYIFTGENLGASARNIGIKEASSEYVLMLDDDSCFEAGTLESLLDAFSTAPDDVAGLNMKISRPDGGLESALLRTVFHGCGFALKKSVFTKYQVYYPEHFCYYGEEYLMTLQLYAAGYRIGFAEGAEVIHRRVLTGRNKGRIFNLMARNNRMTWKGLIDDELLKEVMDCCNWRYHHLAIKENVLEDYQKGLEEEITEVDYDAKLDDEIFSRFALIDKLQALELPDEVVILSTGKLPLIWCRVLKEQGISVQFADLNPGLAGNELCCKKVLSKEEVLELPEDTVFINGLSSYPDMKTWEGILKGRGFKIKTIEV